MASSGRFKLSASLDAPLVDLVQIIFVVGFTAREGFVQDADGLIKMFQPLGISHVLAKDFPQGCADDKLDHGVNGIKMRGQQRGISPQGELSRKSL